MNPFRVVEIVLVKEGGPFTNLPRRSLFYSIQSIMNGRPMLCQAMENRMARNRVKGWLA